MTVQFPTRPDAAATAPTPRRDIPDVPAEARFVGCPDCDGAIFNLPHKRRGHLAWHDDRAKELADLREQLTEAIGELQAARQELADAKRELEQAAAGSTADPVPLLGEWPEEELAGRGADGSRLVDPELAEDEIPDSEVLDEDDLGPAPTAPARGW